MHAQNGTHTMTGLNMCCSVANVLYLNSRLMTTRVHTGMEDGRVACFHSLALQKRAAFAGYDIMSVYNSQYSSGVYLCGCIERVSRWLFLVYIPTPYRW